VRSKRSGVARIGTEAFVHQARTSRALHQEIISLVAEIVWARQVA